MNWEAIGSTAEAIGAVAIVVSLVYVAAQIRQNTREFSRSIEANQLAAFERNIESGNHIRELLMLHPDLAQLLLTGYKSYNELGAMEQFRFGMLLRNIFSAIQGAYIRQLTVEHDPQEFEGTKRMVDDILRNHGAREWLQRNEPDWRPAFRKFVDLRLEAFEQ